MRILLLIFICFSFLYSYTVDSGCGSNVYFSTYSSFSTSCVDSSPYQNASPPTNGVIYCSSSDPKVFGAQAWFGITNSSSCTSGIKASRTSYAKGTCTPPLIVNAERNGCIEPCTPLESNKLTVDVAEENCNAEYFQPQQPVTGLEGNDYSSWYYSNFEYDTCRNTCTYEKVYCPSNEAYGWNENTCVTPPDRGQDECTGEFYCINIEIASGEGSECGKKCYCDNVLVSDTPISCSDTDDNNSTTNNDDNNSTTNNDDNNSTNSDTDNSEDEDNTSIDNNSTNTDTQTPSDCTENQSYNYSTQKCETSTQDTNSTNNSQDEDENNVDSNTTGTVDSNNTKSSIDLIRQDINITNSILRDILNAIKDRNSTSSESNNSNIPGGNSQEEDDSEDRNTSDDNSTGSLGDVEDMFNLQYTKKYTIFDTQCGSPSFDPAVTYMGRTIENPIKIAHEKISPFINQIKLIVILSATLLGLISIFRR